MFPTVYNTMKFLYVMCKYKVGYKYKECISKIYYLQNRSNIILTLWPFKSEYTLCDIYFL